MVVATAAVVEARPLHGEARLREVVDRRAGGTAPFAVAVCAIQEYQEIRDTLGMGVAAALVGATGARLRTALAPEETMVELADGRFGLVLTAARDAAALRERLDGLVRVARGWTPSVFAELTVGAAGGRGPHGDELLTQARLALGEASRRGPGTSVVFDPALLASVRTRVILAADLRRAVESGGLHVHYQPVVALGTRRTVGYEALARWPDPARGWVPPRQFIPAAERAGFIGDVDRYVLRAALRHQALRLQAARNATAWVSVNVSAPDLDDSTFAARTLASVRDHGLPPQRVHLEVTESTLLDTVRGRAQLALLRRAGIRVLLDDFGTGYSSVTSLRQLPLDGIKIARELIAEPAPDPAVLAAVGLLAGSAGIDLVIAEGVETGDQADALRAGGIRYAQGWLFGHPRPPLDRAEIMVKPG